MASSSRNRSRASRYHTARRCAYARARRAARPRTRHASRCSCTRLRPPPAMPDARFLDQLWWGDTPAARAGRAVLRPLELVYGGAVSIRGALYDAGVLSSRAPALATLSVGNIAVGGTGKTPMAAWLAARLRERGAHPALVLR